MLKGKPLLITAIIVGSIGLLLLFFGSVIFLDGGTEPLDVIASVLGLEKGSIKVAAVCQFAIVFEIMAFIVGFNSLKEEII